MPTPPQFDDCFRAAQAGEPAAIHRFFDEYADAVLHVIRYRMNRELRVGFDSTDFMQQTRAELLACDLKDKPFETPEAFLAFIKKIAERQVLQAMRNQRRVKRGGGSARKDLDHLSHAENAQLADPAPQPLAAAAAEEQWQNALAKLPPAYRMIAAKLRDGYTHAEIAQEIGITERTVRRVVARLRELYGLDKEEGDQKSNLRAPVAKQRKATDG